MVAHIYCNALKKFKYKIRDIIRNKNTGQQDSQHVHWMEMGFKRGRERIRNLKDRNNETEKQNACC